MRAEYSFLLLLMTACVPKTGQQPSDSVQVRQQTAGENRVLGRVAVVGSAPMNVSVVVQDASGRDTRIDGPLAGEIRQLAGAQVEVRGRLANRAIQATDYEIRAVNGAPVEMGVVQRAADGSLQLRKADGRTVSLMGATSQFRVGQKVWVQGPAAVRVQSYGVITP